MRRSRRIIGISVAAAVSAGGLGVGPTAADPAWSLSASSTPIAEDTSWQALVPSTTPTPQSILQPRGVSVVGGGVLRGGATTLRSTVGSPASIVLDFGRVVSGSIDLTFGPGSGPGAITTVYSETLAGLGPIGDFSLSAGFAGSGTPVTADVRALTGSGRVSGPPQGGFRYVRVTLTTPTTATLTGVALRGLVRLRSAQDYQGHFVSSSDELNRIWAGSAYTTNLVLSESRPGFRTPLIFDAAKRDRALWSGDLLISAPAAHAFLGSAASAYVAGSLDMLAAHPATASAPFPAFRDARAAGPMPGQCRGDDSGFCVFYSATYSMNFAQAVADHWMRTGDRAGLTRWWPLVSRAAQWQLSLVDPVTKLVQTDAFSGLDWSVDPHAGEYTATSVLHVASLRSASTVADALGDSASAARYRTAADATASSINRLLWNEDIGAYGAALDRRGLVVQDANAWALYFGLVPPDRVNRVHSALTTRLATPFGPRSAPENTPGYTSKVSPYIGSFQLATALRDCRVDDARRQLAQTWGSMLDRDPASTMWESIGLPSGTVGDTTTAAGAAGNPSATHAWSAGPTSSLPEDIGGTVPTGPGYRTWSITPRRAGLMSAQAQTPTPYGPISSRWTADENGFRLTTIAPSVTSGDVAVPVADTIADIYRDGRLVFSGGRAQAGVSATVTDGRVVFHGVTGTHTYAWAGDTTAARGLC